MIATTRVLACLMAAALVAGAARSAHAESALVAAARRGDAVSVRTALAERVDPNLAEADGTTALHWAAYHNHLEVARLLIAAKANPQAANRYGVRPLSLASQQGHAAMIALLVRSGADPNTTLAEGETALMSAARSGVVEAVQALVEGGADVNARESWRAQTALMWAAAEGHAPVIRLLVASGADTKARSKLGFTPLLFAAREGHIEAVRTLLDVGSSLDEMLSVNSRQSAGGVDEGKAEPDLDAFLLAAANAHYELAAYLMDRGASARVAPRGWTALHQISWTRKTGEAGGNDPPPEGSGRMGSLEFVRALVAHGADVNAKVTSRGLPVGSSGLDFRGATPFLLAARTADVELMKLLLELGADPLARTTAGTTPLMVAAGLGAALPGEEPGTEAESLEAVALMLKLGDDINAVDASGNTAMHGAAYKHFPAMARYLAGHGARVDIWNRPNKAGHTPLAIAAGIQRGMNFVFSPETEAAIQSLLPAR